MATCLTYAALWFFAVAEALAAASPASVEGSARRVGIEGVYTLRYDGPVLELKPAGEKSPIALRIADVADDGPAKVYELRYIGVRPGQFDLRDYLRRVDGGPTDGVPSAVVVIQQVLPEDHDGTLAEVDNPPRPWFWPYRLTLLIVGVLWLVPLAVLALRRVLRHRPAPQSVIAAPMTLADQLRPLVAAAIAGRLTPEGQARLELLLIAHWRERLELGDCSLAEALEGLRRHPEAGGRLEQVTQWLHRRPDKTASDVAAILAPYQQQPAVPEEVIAEASSNRGLTLRPVPRHNVTGGAR